MKSSQKGAGKTIAAHKAEGYDTLPQHVFQPRSSSDKQAQYKNLPADPCDPTPDELLVAQEDFRQLLRENMRTSKAPSHLLQKIRQSIRQAELKA